jgi:hypothetical protein
MILGEWPPDTDIDAYGWMPRAVAHGRPLEAHDESEEKFDVTLRYLHGTIRKVHTRSARSDGSIVDGPCLEVNCPFEHQMSGGPVFGPDLWLCGIISASENYYRQAEGPHAEPRSFVATLLPLVGCEISYRFPGNGEFAEYTIKEIAERGFMHIAGLEHTSLTFDEDGRVAVVHLHPKDPTAGN